jgi:pyrophosphatase PpaX
VSPRFQTVLFDLDGTLIDSEELILASFRHTLRTHRDAVPPDEVFRVTIGQPLVVQFRSWARDDEELDAMIRTYVEHNRARHDSMVRPFPGVDPVLERLRREGVRLGIVTSKRGQIAERGLRRCGIPSEWFAAIVTSDDVTRYKPDPEPVTLALARMGETDPGRTIFVGDSTHDMKAGRAAGTRTAAALWGPYSRAQLEPTSPDYWLPAPSSIWEILDGRPPPG